MLLTPTHRYKGGGDSTRRWGPLEEGEASNCSKTTQTPKSKKISTGDGKTLSYSCYRLLIPKLLGAPWSFLIHLQIPTEDKVIFKSRYSRSQWLLSQQQLGKQEQSLCLFPMEQDVSQPLWEGSLPTGSTEGKQHKQRPLGKSPGPSTASVCCGLKQEYLNF